MNAAVVETTVVGVVVGGNEVVVDMKVVEVVGGKIVVVMVTGTSPVVVVVETVVVEVMETGTSPVIVVVEGANLVVVGAAAVVVITEPQRSEGMVAGIQDVVDGSHVAFFMLEEEEHEYVTIDPAVLVVPSQSDTVPDGATGGSSEHSREHPADIVLSTPIPPATVHTSPPPCTHCLVVVSVLI